MKYVYLFISFILFGLVNPPLCIAQLSQGGLPISSASNLILSEPEYQIMPLFDVDKMMSEDEMLNANKTGPFRFGKNFETSFTLENSGTWTNLQNEGQLWQLGISSPGAYSINLIFGDFFVPEGASLFIYNENKTHILGAFTHLNNHSKRQFATDLIKGDKVILEYYEPKKVKNQGSLLISTVTHGYRDLFNLKKKDFGTSGACNINVNCPLGLSWEDQIKSVVMLVSGGNGFCSGVLINNTALDGKPYILTANHCGTSGFETWIFRFNWEAPRCTNPATSPPFQSLTGSEKRANNPNSDFLLVELFDQIPLSYNPYFSGWSNEDVPATNGVGIHHPSGDIKKISEYIQPVENDNWSGTETWKVISWNRGTTEPGSSGSPLFDQNQRIIGQLYGGFASCNDTLEDYYGKFSKSWNGILDTARLKDWLDPLNTGVTIFDGFNPGLTSFKVDVGITSVISPEQGSLSCTDSVTPVIVIRNFGTDVLNSVTINYQINELPLPSEFWTGNLNQGSIDTLILSPISVPLGNNTITVFTSDPNSSPDQNPSNDTAKVNFKIEKPESPVSISPAFKEEFETSLFPTQGWSHINPDNNVNWTRTTSASGFGIGEASARIHNFNYKAVNERDFLISPPLDFTSVISPVILEFNVAYARFSNTRHDSLIISVSTDCMLSWERVYSKGDIPLSTNNGANVTNSFVPQANEWRKETINLDQFKEQIILIRFENINGNGNNLYLDNINISDATSSINNITVVNLFNVFPNPSFDIFNIEMTKQAKEIKVYNLLGEVIIKVNINKDEFLKKIDLSAFSAGIYIIELSFHEEKQRNKLCKLN